MIYQKPTKTITTAYTTTDADIGYRIICNSETAFTITLHTAGRSNFDMEINNMGAGDVTCGGQTISQYSHAHVGNTGTEWTVSIGGGYGGTSVSGQFDYGLITDATNTIQDWGGIA